MTLPDSASAGRRHAASGRVMPWADALRDASYEILPFRSTEADVLKHVPTDVALTVTTTEAKGLEPTIALAERLTEHGYRAAPHIAARLVRDDHHLADIVARLNDAEIKGIFVIGGDASTPAGTFQDALSLLQALDRMNHRLESVGIGGYPEGHGHIPDDVIQRAVEAKAAHATHIISQLCFDADATKRWAGGLKAAGVNLPVRVGLPGAVNRQKLVRISASLGLGQSARFLQKQKSMLWRFFLPGGYRPDRVLRSLAESFGDSGQLISGVHLFTFNELEATERWRQSWLERVK